MKRLLLALCLLTPAGCYEQRSSTSTPAPAPAPSPPAETPHAVTGATLAEEELDSDGDGKIDTWRRAEPDGVIVERRDTDGDGKPDQTKRLEPLEEPPPGIGIQLEGLEGKPDPDAPPSSEPPR